MVETTYDLRYNIAACIIAICSESYVLPETAFSILEEKLFKLGNEDWDDMIALREQQITYREIGDMYGLSDSSVFHGIKRYKKRSEKVV